MHSMANWNMSSRPKFHMKCSSSWRDHHQSSWAHRWLCVGLWLLYRFITVLNITLIDTSFSAPCLGVTATERCHDWSGTSHMPDALPVTTGTWNRTSNVFGEKGNMMSFRNSLNLYENFNIVAKLFYYNLHFNMHFWSNSMFSKHNCTVLLNYLLL